MRHATCSRHCFRTTGAMWTVSPSLLLVSLAHISSLSVVPAMLAPQCACWPCSPSTCQPKLVLLRAYLLPTRHSRLPVSASRTSLCVRPPCRRGPIFPLLFRFRPVPTRRPLWPRPSLMPRLLLWLPVIHDRCRSFLSFALAPVPLRPSVPLAAFRHTLHSRIRPLPLCVMRKSLSILILWNASCPMLAALLGPVAATPSPLVISTSRQPRLRD